MKKALSIFLALVLTLSCVLGSFSSAFAFNDGMTDDEVFDMCWNLACMSCDKQAFDACFLEDFTEYQYNNELQVILDGICSEECKLQVRDAIRKVGTNPENLWRELWYIVFDYIQFSTFNVYHYKKLENNRDKYASKLGSLLAEAYNDVKDAMNEQLVLEFRSNKYGEEIAKYFDQHTDEIAALIPQEYLSLCQLSADQLLQAAELYLYNNQQSIVDIIEQLLNSDDNLATKQLAIKNSLSEVLINIIESIIGPNVIPREYLTTALEGIVSEYSEVVCNRFETYLGTMAVSNPNSVILSGGICLVIGIIAGIFIGKKKKAE